MISYDCPGLFDKSDCLWGHVCRYLGAEHSHVDSVVSFTSPKVHHANNDCQLRCRRSPDCLLLYRWRGDLGVHRTMACRDSHVQISEVHASMCVLFLSKSIIDHC